MHLEIRQTKDGSNTLYVPDLNEHYHSVHGALQESQHVFIKHGLEHVLEQKKDIKVLEVGFGTGLNAILTFPVALAQKAFIQYDTLEKHPLSAEVVQQLQYGQFILNPELLDYFRQLHDSPWNEPVEDMVTLSISPERAPDEPEYVEIGFEQGLPVSVDGARL